MSSTSLTPPPDIWAGKSRNAKAQARHRAKRKAYIEQLEQTVSKLQTALALSAEDVTNLPTTQTKLRELKEENDSLRAELRKYQLQQAANFSLSSVIPMQNNPSPDDMRRYTKRRRLSSVEGEPRYTYLDSVGSGIEPVATPSHLMTLPANVQSRGYHLQGPGGMTVPESPQSTTPMRDDEQFGWSSYIPPPQPSQLDSPPWSYPAGHVRNRSASSNSSASSETAPTPYMMSNRFNVQLSESPFRHSRHLPTGDSSSAIQVKPDGKLEMDAVTSGLVSLYNADNGVSAKRAELAIDTLNMSANGPWSDIPVWPYSTVRAF